MKKYNVERLLPILQQETFIKEEEAIQFLKQAKTLQSIVDGISPSKITEIDGIILSEIVVKISNLPGKPAWGHLLDDVEDAYEEKYG